MVQHETSMQTLRRWILKCLITRLAIFAAFSLVPDITFSRKGYEKGVIAIIYSVFNLRFCPVKV